MGHPDFQLMNMIEQKSKLAGSNQMELLLFSLGGTESFGINVFKVREVCATMPVTRTPHSPPGVTGIISLRGAVLPVIDLATCLDMPFEGERSKMIITEFSSHTQAFCVANVDRIVRVDWELVKPPHQLAGHSISTVTAVTELPGGKLVSILDVEQILASVIGEVVVPDLEPLLSNKSTNVFFADDSALARKKIMEVLDKMGMPYQYAQTGAEAWSKLTALADRAEASGTPLRESLCLVLTDAEMPEMDGYVLTRNIKADRRFEGIPVMMHSSLSSVANQKLGQQVGVDAYIPKFNPDDLSQALRNMVAH